MGQISKWRCHVGIGYMGLEPRTNTGNKNIHFGGFPGGAVVENPPANAGDTGSSPGLGRSHMPWSN